MERSLSPPFSSNTNLELPTNSPTFTLEMLRPSIHEASFIQYLISLIKVSIVNLPEDKIWHSYKSKYSYILILKPRPINNDSDSSCTNSQYLRALELIHWCLMPDYTMYIISCSDLSHTSTIVDILGKIIFLKNFKEFFYIFFKYQSNYSPISTNRFYD